MKTKMGTRRVNHSQIIFGGYDISECMVLW